MVRKNSTEGPNLSDLQHPLENSFTLNKLMALEEAYFSHRSTPELISELCHIYSNLVQFYDVKNDPIQMYFLERIQVVSCTKSLLCTSGKQSSNGEHTDDTKSKLL